MNLLSQLRDSGRFTLLFPPYVWWLFPTKTESLNATSDSLLCNKIVASPYPVIREGTAFSPTARNFCLAVP